MCKDKLSPNIPTGDNTTCNNENSSYTTIKPLIADSTVWFLEPDTSGTLVYTDTTVNITWQQNFSGTAKLYSQIFTNYSGGESSDTLSILVSQSYLQQTDTTICYRDSVFGNIFTTNSILYDTLFTISGCDSIFITNITVNPLPVLSLGEDTTIFTTDSLILTAGSSFNSYLWSTGTTDSIIIIDSIQFGQGTHLVWLEVSDSNSCINSDTISITIILPVNSIMLFNDNTAFLLYPNPSDGIIHISVPAKSKKAELTVYNQQGNKMFFTVITETDKLINLSSLNAGVYVIQLKAKSKIFSKKIIIK